MNYQVDPGALSRAAPKFDALAWDTMAHGRSIADEGSNLCDSLGDPSVVTAVGSAVTALLGDLQMVFGGVSQLASGVGENAAAYIKNEEQTAQSYQGARNPRAS